MNTHPAAISTPKTTGDTPLQWVHHTTLPVATREALLVRLQQLPRPPSGMQELLSDTFIAQASSVELGKLIQSEPMITARILARVNSPMYRLQTPVASIGQAITFLGMNQVRGICMQAMLAQCFQSKDVQTLSAMDLTWRSNAAAVLLLPRMASLFHLKDVSALTSRIILAGVGPLASVVLMAAQQLTSWGQAERSARYLIEQESLGLNAAELGGMLLHSWGIPDVLIADILAMERMLVEVPTKVDPSCLGHAAGYLSLWIADQLVRRLHGADDPNWIPLQEPSSELHFLRQMLSALGNPWNEHLLGDETSLALYAAARQGAGS